MCPVFIMVLLFPVFYFVCFSTVWAPSCVCLACLFLPLFLAFLLWCMFWSDVFHLCDCSTCVSLCSLPFPVYFALCLSFAQCAFAPTLASPYGCLVCLGLCFWTDTWFSSLPILNCKCASCIKWHWNDPALPVCVGTLGWNPYFLVFLTHTVWAMATCQKNTICDQV